ncbi:MFS transporter [Streptomyces sp. N2-109]|uniref:MFS transporter n=1 Tax=Streptomyces gossypii TaxID=2883101 RepID=A0ABT2K4U7_9ACTN|nr:MFS transporter [Streptomyces gossypii]MCT2594664.1 MFS transporter [Streptomyces gossypii]
MTSERGADRGRERSQGLALATLTTCVFLVGTAEWVMVGLLPDLSADLDLPLPAVGSLVTWYALTVTVAGPLVTVLLLRFDRKRALLGLVALFVAGNATAALAGGFGMLVAARMVTALTHSTAFAVALVIAVSMSPAAYRGRAISVVAAGWNLATVFGAPLGTWIGGQYGWRATFWSIAGLSALALAAVAVLVRAPAAKTVPRAGAEVRALLDRRVATVLVIVIAAQAGLFTVYTYVVPLLREVSGFGPTAATVLLAVFGFGALSGNVLGGRLADRAPWGALCVLLAGLASVLGLFTFTSRAQVTAAVTVLVLGMIAGALIPLLQERALAAAPGAPTLVTAVVASAFNLGIAGGSGLGGEALGGGFGLGDGPGGGLGLGQLPWIGGLVALLALPPAARAALRHRHHHRHRHRAGPHDRADDPQRARRAPEPARLSR